MRRSRSECIEGGSRGAGSFTTGIVPLFRSLLCERSTIALTNTYLSFSSTAGMDFKRLSDLK